MKIGILTADSNGCFPVPASKGGAVSTLIESLIRENSEKGLAELTIFSYYDEKAYKKSRKYSNVNFIWVKVPKYIKKLDSLFYKIIKKKSAVKAISYKSIFSLIYYIKYVSKYLKKNRFDKLILENNIPIAWIIQLSHYNGQYYYHLHNVPRINPKCKKVFDKCTGYLCVSKYVAHEIESTNNPIGPVAMKKVKVVYNAIDTGLFRQYSLAHKSKIRQEIKKQYHINQDDKIVLFTGRISKEKGLDVLLDALKEIRSNKYKLLIVGSVMHGSNNKDEYFTLINKKVKSILPNVVFTGYIDHSRLPDFYNVADVTVLPSMWEEPAGLTMIEALACGSPVITTRTGGIPEYVEGSAIVLNRDSRLITNLANQIDNVLNNLRVYRDKGVFQINNRFSEKNYLERFLKSIN